MKSRHCELCNADAAVFCPSDAAFLCRSCDSEVHDANFLVARHVRRPLTGQEIAGGAGPQPPRSICNSCSDEDEDGVVSSGYSSCSSDCVSRTTSPAREYSGGRRDSGGDSPPSNKRRRQRGGDSRRVDFMKAEGIFVDWCGKLGVGADVAVGTACRGLRACSGSWTVLPFRVCLAASMWLGLRLSGDESVSTWRVLKRMEEISGVPAKVIVAAELKLERGFRGGRRLERRRLELEEGWAEC